MFISAIHLSSPPLSFIDWSPVQFGMFSFSLGLCLVGPIRLTARLLDKTR